MSKLIITEAKPEDMDFFVASAKKEGWNPGLQDSTPFYQTDPHGFFLGTFEGEKIGCISAPAYNSEFGFMGFYIVLPDYRHHGFGLQLWAHGLNYLGDRAIGLDGVLNRQKDYEQSGFHFHYKNHRFERKDKTAHLSASLVSLKEIPFETLLNYDSAIFGFQRAIFLKLWIQMSNIYSLGKREEGRLLGYGVLRACYEGYKIGPLFADNTEIAIEIFESLCAKANGAAVYLDVPEINPQAMQIAKAFNLKHIFETVRMYTKTPPKQQLEKVYGVTTFELG